MKDNKENVKAAKTKTKTNAKYKAPKKKKVQDAVKEVKEEIIKEAKEAKPEPKKVETVKVAPKKETKRKQRDPEEILNWDDFSIFEKTSFILEMISLITVVVMFILYMAGKISSDKVLPFIGIGLILEGITMWRHNKKLSIVGYAFGIITVICSILIIVL